MPLGCCAGALIAYGIGATVIASVTGGTIIVLLWTLAGGIVGMGIGGRISLLFFFRGPKQQPGTPMGLDGADKTTSQPGAQSLTSLGKTFFSLVYEVARDGCKFGIGFALLGWLLFALFGLIGNGVEGALWEDMAQRLQARSDRCLVGFARHHPHHPPPLPKIFIQKKI